MTIDARMQKLVLFLNDAAKSYYNGIGESTLTDKQYDLYLLELKELEEAAGYHLEDSPTNRIGFEESGDKIKHPFPILSLKDTKNIADLLYFLGEEEGLLSWKLDGVSIVLYYRYGVLTHAVSRGDGMYGRDITENVLLMSAVPQTISLQNDLIVRGEGCMAIDDFETLKQTPEGERYRNPRNLAAGLINSISAKPVVIGRLTFVAHSVMMINGYGRNLKTKDEQLRYLEDLGFEVVPYVKVANYFLTQEIEHFTYELPTYEYPVDGLVLTMNSIDHGLSLGKTLRYPRDTMAFKWEDASKLTKVKGMKWSVSPTGLITPVVIVEPTEMEGTTVKQANLHSLKCFEDLQIGIGDTLEIYKANKIIPEVKENLTRSGTEPYPQVCPVCGHETQVVITNKTRKLYCTWCGRENLEE